MPQFLCISVIDINPHTKFQDATIKENLKFTSYINLNLAKSA